MTEKEATGIVLRPTYVPATITADWETIEANVARMVEPYAGVTPEAASMMDLKEAKACCADLRRISRELNDGRKAVKAEYNRPLAEFEERIKAIDALIKEPLATIDAAVKIEEARAKEERRAHLERAYEDFAPALVPVVPFERVLEPQWLNKSFGQKKAEAAMTEKVARIAADWESFKLVRGNYAFPDEAEAEFFRTLSLRAANELDAARREEAERIARLHAEVAANRGEEPEPAFEPEAEPEPAFETEPEPEPAFEPMPEPAFEEVRTWYARLEITDSQKRTLVDVFRRVGIHGRLSTTLEGLVV